MKNYLVDRFIHWHNEIVGAIFVGISLTDLTRSLQCASAFVGFITLCYGLITKIKRNNEKKNNLTDSNNVAIDGNKGSR